MLMKPSPSVAPMQLLVGLQTYKINHAGRNSSKNQLNQIISVVEFTAIAWHLSNQLILHSQTCTSFSPLFLLCRRRSKAWSVQWPIWKWAWDPIQHHHARPQGPLLVFLLHLPKTFSLQEQAPQIPGTVCRAHGSWSGVAKGQNWRLVYQLPSLKCLSATDTGICRGNTCVSTAHLPVCLLLLPFILRPFQTQRCIPAAFREVWDRAT